MLENLTPPQGRRGKCKIKSIASDLEMSDADLFWKYMNDPDTWSAYALAQALGSRGLQVSVNTILRHRNGLCAC